MVRIIVAVIFIVSACVGKPLNKNNMVRTVSGLEFKDSLKKFLYDKCINYDSASYIFDITLTQLNQNTYVYISPVRYIEYLDYKKDPFIYYELNGRLFLIYSGLSSFLKSDSDYFTELQKIYYRFCNEHRIGKLTSTNDTTPLFFKVEDLRLTEYNDSHFQDVFFERKFDTTKYVPVVID